MNTNTLISATNISSIFANTFTLRIAGLNYWKVTMAFLSTLIIGGYALSMITGWAAFILVTSMGLAFLLKPLTEILYMDFDLTNLELNDLHEELWH